MLQESQSKAIMNWLVLVSIFQVNWLKHIILGLLVEHQPVDKCCIAKVLSLFIQLSFTVYAISPQFFIMRYVNLVCIFSIQVCCSGHGKNGALTVLQQSIRPDTITQVCIPPLTRYLWHSFGICIISSSH